MRFSIIFRFINICFLNVTFEYSAVEEIQLKNYLLIILSTNIYWASKYNVPDIILDSLNTSVSKTKKQLLMELRFNERRDEKKAIHIIQQYIYILIYYLYNIKCGICYKKRKSVEQIKMISNDNGEKGKVVILRGATTAAPIWTCCFKYYKYEVLL